MGTGGSFPDKCETPSTFLRHLHRVVPLETPRTPSFLRHGDDTCTLGNPRVHNSLHPDACLSHILVCFLELVIWGTLEHWMGESGIGTAPRKLMEELIEVRSLDVILSTYIGKAVLPRVVSKPGKRISVLLKSPDSPPPNKPKRASNILATLP